ncbi:MAG: hypothetical protein QOF19_2904 [Alphaproteobacteria bacterium]|jgi:hypothetical protein|nr:hypothetical protein [Alphaproteobacteria bacterium]
MGGANGLRRQSLRNYIPVITIAAFVLSGCVWVLRDQRVWSYDQAFYGHWTLQLWHAAQTGPAEWLETMANALGQMPPMLVWLGQIVLPVRYVTGGTESALPLLTILLAAATLAIVYLLARRLGAGLIGSLAAVIACAGSPLFLAFSLLYLTEMTQAFSVAVAIFVAWRAERRSLTRTLALCLSATALGFLAKSSSIVFLVPMLTYVAVALFISRGRPKSRTSIADISLVAMAVMLLAATATWYAYNWESMVQHLVGATTGESALNYGSRIELIKKLSYWISWLDLSLSPINYVSICIGVLIVVAIGVALVRVLLHSPSQWAPVAVENGTLFGLALAGMLVVVILAYSLQINEDPRFLAPAIPVVAALIGWSFSMIGSRLIAGLAVLGLAANAVAVHAYAHNINPFGLKVHPWLLPVDAVGVDKALLTHAVRSTCRKDTANYATVIAVNYTPLNANSASFYSFKQRETLAYFCNYRSLSYSVPEFQRALDEIIAMAPAYVVTVAPEKQSPVDFANIHSRALAEYLAKDPLFELSPDSGDYLQIYRNKRVLP